MDKTTPLLLTISLCVGGCSTFTPNDLVTRNRHYQRVAIDSEPATVTREVWREAQGRIGNAVQMEQWPDAARVRVVLGEHADFAAGKALGVIEVSAHASGSMVEAWSRDGWAREKYVGPIIEAVKRSCSPKG